MILDDTGLKPENWIAIGSAFLTALITGAGLYIGPKIAVKRSIEQFRSQKWWENQANAYASLLSKLAILKHHNRVWYVWAVEHEEIPEDKKGDFVKENQKTMKELERAATADSLYLSDKAINAVEAFIRQSGRAGTDFVAELEGEWQAIEGCIKVVREAANGDLRSSASS